MINKLLNKYKNMSVPLKASLWYTVSNILVKGVSLLSTPIFTRVMTQAEYGTFTLFQSWYNIIIIFTSLNIFLGGYTKGLLLYRNEIEDYTASSLFQTFVLTCAWGVVYLINIDFWTKVFNLSPILMLMMFFELVTAPAFEFWACRARFEYKYKKVVTASIFTSVLSIVLGVITVISSQHKVEARAFSDVFAKALVTAPLFVLLMLKGRHIFKREYWKYNFAFNMPLLPHYLSNYALNQSDRVMISNMIGNAQAAQYSIAYTISMMMTLVTTAINNTLTPYIYQSIDKRQEDNIKSATTPIFFLISVFSIISMAFGPEIIIVFAGKSYSDAVWLVPPISASVYFIFLYSMFSTIEYFYQKTTRIAIATMIAAVINVGLNYVFIKQYGYYAAGYTTLISYIVLSLMHYVFYRILVKDKFKTGTQLYDVRVIMLNSVIVLVAMFLMLFTYKVTIIRYAIIVALLLVGVFKRKEIISLLSSLKKQ